MKVLKVKCVNDYVLFEKNLTMFKIYDVVDELKRQYKIIDDTGKENLYCKSLFQIISTADENTLNEKKRVINNG
ncbi:hypothetical protein CLOACE_02520 [Clostridium acetireducens DSM 10703]|jgi:hypothetical protein|uniref:Uncharacterized protein n=1 Tax=Clostridium acetireducens DSM 10703 TaxID=1121290 RepID=A0A1E8F1N7_9CLOT|nr:hypothetical protein [Clostridium acetireducens]OFI07424.1 hypothetical protein CLOACE_02520 [Clostridium acetireducens DSM 10703]